MTRPPRYRCHTCAATFTAYAPAERCADAHGGARIDLFLAPINRQGGHMSRASNRKLRREGEGRIGQPRPSLKTSEPLPATPPLPPAKKTKRGVR